MSAPTARRRRPPGPVPAAVTSLVRTVLAGLSGALFADAAHARATGAETAAMLLWAFAVLTAGWVALSAVVDVIARAATRRRARAITARARQLRRENRALRRAVAVWRTRAIRWQAEAERAEAEAQTAMLHTPMGKTLLDVSALPDTRDRQR